MNPPPWLPDWKDKDNYPGPKTTSDEWAWQFLRRNPAYQQMWLELIRPHYNPSHVETSFRRIKREAQLQRVFDRVRERLDEGDYPLAPFEERFRISTVPPDPAEPDAKVLFAAQITRYARKPVGRRGTSPGWVYQIPIILRDHDVLVWFDLGRSIAPQLKQAKRLLDVQAAKSSFVDFRYQPKNYQRYLRLLDAKSSDATNAQIAKILYPHLSNAWPDRPAKRQASADLKTAKRLRDHDFWLIARDW
jgi:type VI secretion system activator RovC-like protein/transcriptional regulator